MLLCASKFFVEAVVFEDLVQVVDADISTSEFLTPLFQGFCIVDVGERVVVHSRIRADHTDDKLVGLRGVVVKRADQGGIFGSS